MRCLLILLTGVLTLAAQDGYARGTAMLGVRGLHPVSLSEQAGLGLLPGQGVQIGWVMPGSPAAEMGLRPGDVITAINGQPVTSGPDLRRTVWSFQAGDGASVTVRQPGARDQELLGTYGTLPGFIADRVGTPMLNRHLNWREAWWSGEVAAQRMQLAQAQEKLRVQVRALDELERRVASAEAATATVTASGSGAWRLRWSWNSDSIKE